MTLIEMQSYLFHPTIHIIFRSVVERRKKHRDSDRDAELPLPPYNSYYFQECGLKKEETP